MAGGSEGRDSGRSPPDTDTGRAGDLMGLEASANEHGPLFSPRAAPKMEGPGCASTPFGATATRPFNIAPIMRRQRTVGFITAHNLRVMFIGRL